MNSKKIIITAISLSLTIAMFAGCSKEKEAQTSQNREVYTGRLAVKEEYEDTAVCWEAEKNLSLGADVVVKIDGEYIKYINPKTAASAYACSRSNCDHKSEKCQAYFGGGCLYACRDNIFCM